MKEAPEELGLCAQNCFQTYMAAPNRFIAIMSKGYCFIYLVDEVPGLHDLEDFKGFLSPMSSRPHVRTVEDIMLKSMFTERKCFFLNDN